MGQRRVQGSGCSSQDREDRARYTLQPKAHPFVRSSLPLALLVLAFCCLLSASFSFAGDLDLDDLIKEALSNNHEVLVS